MRRFEKKLIIDLLSSLINVQELIKDEYRLGKTENAVNLLCKCQDAAVSIGEMFKKDNKVDCLFVRYLDDYCQCLYRIAQNIVSKSCSENDFNDLTRLHNNIRQNIDNDISIKLEIVFLPYKASMWCSLESIWQTAHDDPDCDAYVIPIPYYDRKADKSPGDMHYEGELFPDYVPVTHFKNYDLSARRPDAVFIHNPYDDYNLVVMIDRQYFSENLKKCTDCLVYVPYFTFASKESIKRHFFIMPGVINSNHVITQSDEINDFYIDEYKNITGINPGKDKFLPLGSPIVDKIYSTNSKNITIPDEWKDIINNKKVVLYNTSIQGILNNGEKALLKMEHVFKTFQQFKNIVLLWRPHPLNETTLSSINPSLLEKYRQLINRYKKNKWGVYDDSSDVTRAILLSDAYYGMGGSLLAMYRLTDRPVLLQDYILHEKSKPDATRYSAGFECFVECDDTLWVSAYHFNGLFKIDKNDMKPKYMGSFPGEDFHQDRLFSSAVKVNDTLYFCPLAAQSIAKYSITENKFSKIDLPDFIHKKIKKSYQGYKFFQCAAFDNVIFFFGILYPGIIYYDISNSLFGTVDEIDNEISRNFTPFFSQIHTYGKYAVSMLIKQGKIIVLNMENKKIEIVYNTELDSGFVGICFDGKNYYFISHGNGPLVSWNRTTQEVESAITLPSVSQTDNDNINRFVMPVVHNNAIWLFPYTYNEVIRIDVSTKEIETVQDLSEALLDAQGNGGKVKLAWSDNEYIYVFSENHPCLFRYSTASGVEIISLILEQQDEAFIREQLDKFKYDNFCKTVQFENTKLNVRDYLSFISLDTSNDRLRTDPDQRAVLNNYGNSGEKIFSKIKSTFKEYHV